MATGVNTALIEENELGNSADQSLPACPDVLGALYAAHYGYVFRLCRRFLERPEDAEDAAAEVFLKLHRVLGSRDEALAFRPWLSQVTGRHCIDMLRKKKRERRYCVEGEEIATVPDLSNPSPLSQALHDEEQRLLREELCRLPRHYRVPLVLRYYKRMSYKEIARALGRQLPAIKMTLFRAKRELRRRLMALERARAAA
jgi:RNA polymerase sigma-70 factor (ECF subfamily)